MAFARFVCKQLHAYLLTRNFKPCSVVLYFFCSLTTCTFCATESTKEQGSRVRHSALPLFKSCFATSFSRFTPRPSLLVAMLGVARTRCAQTFSHNDLHTSGLSLSHLRCRFFLNITIVRCKRLTCKSAGEPLWLNVKS